MTATLNAKVSISDAEQVDPAALAITYDTMAMKFQTTGLNIDAIAQMRQYFSNLKEGLVEPLFYSQFPVPLPPHAVRLSVIFFQKADPDLAQLVHEAAQDIMNTLPSHIKYHRNDPEHYHITVYMTSQPHTLCPDPFDISRKLPTSESSPQEIHKLVTPEQETLGKETEVIRHAAAATPPPQFEVHRVLLADSGTLLLCNVDVSGSTTPLRRRLKESFPAGPPRQSTIYHSSLARILSPEQLDKEMIQKMQAVCDKWSRKLKGRQFRASALYHVSEERFATVEGPAVELPFRSAK